jgi:hypothetical protein
VDSEAARPRPKGLGRSTASGATGIMACAGCWWNTVLEGWSSMEGRKMEILWTLKHQSEIYCQVVLGNQWEPWEPLCSTSGFPNHHGEPATNQWQIFLDTWPRK